MSALTRARALTEQDRQRLLVWLKDNARDMAAELREAGWEEDAGGLWNKGNHRRLHLYDAHAVAIERES